jgi:3-hydroxyisobutyrate dehydrogenase
MTEAPTVALLGTGTMGAGMARNIAGAGLALRVWNRTRSKAEPLAEAGALVADTAADAVAGADIVVTMLFDAEAVADAMEQARGGLREGAVWLQQSTVGVEGATRLAGLAERLGLAYVDAPVLGTKKPADDGALVVLASGPDSVRSAVEPVLDAIGSRTVWVGAAGQGSRLKLVANAWVLTVVEGIAECLSLAEALGVEPGLFLEVVKGGAMDAPYVQLKGGAMLEGDFAPSFGLDGAAKDADLIVAAARAVGADVGVVEAVQSHFARALASGHGDLDLAATYLTHGRG